MLVGESCASFLFEQEGLAGLEGEGGQACRRAGFQRPGAEAGEIKAQVMVVPGNFDGHGAAVPARQRAPARQALVGALKPLNRQHRPVLDHDGLANFEAGDFFGDAKAKRRCRPAGLRIIWARAGSRCRASGV